MGTILNKDNLETIGVGGHGIVYRVKHTNIAIKQAKNERVSLVNEGEILKTLQNVGYFPSLYAYNQETIVMEYVQGKVLSEWLLEGNTITTDIINQVRDAFRTCLSLGVYLVEPEPDHIILSEQGIRIIDVGMYRKIEVIENPKLIEKELETFNTHFLNKVHQWR